MLSVRPWSGTSSRRREARGSSDPRLRITALVTGGALAAAVAGAAVFAGQDAPSSGTGARPEPPVAQALRLHAPGRIAAEAEPRGEGRVSGLRAEVLDGLTMPVSASPLTFDLTAPAPAHDGGAPASRLLATAVLMSEEAAPSSWSVSPPPSPDAAPDAPLAAAHKALARGYSPVPDNLRVVGRARADLRVVGHAPAASAAPAPEPQQVVYEIGAPAELKPSFRLICDTCPGFHYVLGWAQHWVLHHPAPTYSPNYTQQEAIVHDAVSIGLIVVQKGGQMNLAEWNF